MKNAELAIKAEFGTEDRRFDGHFGIEFDRIGFNHPSSLSEPSGPLPFSKDSDAAAVGINAIDIHLIRTDHPIDINQAFIAALGGNLLGRQRPAIEEALGVTLPKRDMAGRVLVEQGIEKQQPALRNRRRMRHECNLSKTTCALVGGQYLSQHLFTTRCFGLNNTAIHRHESQDAYFSYLFRQSGDYQYNPLLHGPLRFYLTGLMYVLFGDSNFTARLAPALMGASMIPMCWLLRPLLGRIAAFAAAALFAFGPSYLYFSRFAREDIYIAAITLGLLVAIWRFLDHPRKYHPAIIGALLALSFATKETTFITVFVMGSFFLVRVRDPGLAPAGRGRRSSAPAAEGWGWFLAAFAGIFTILFTTFLTHPGGLWDGVYTGLKYWLDQHGVARGGEPWQFYSTVLITIEWPALILGAIGAVSLWRRKPLLRRLPDLGLPALAGRLLVGGREVRVARPAPAAAARPARRRRPPGDLGGARRAGATSASPARRSRSSTSASRSGGSTWTAAPTRARCSSPPSPRPRSRTSPTRSWRSPRAAARASRR